MKVNRGQLAEIFGKAEPTIDAFVREGMPFLSKPQRGTGAGRAAWEFDSARCIEWFVKREAPNSVKNSEKDALALRQQKAEVSLIEVRAATALRSVVLVSDAVRVYEEKASVVKSLIRAIPGRVAAAVAEETDPAKVLIILKTEIHAALEGITNPKLKEAVMDLAKSGEADADSMPVAVLVGPGEPEDGGNRGAPAAPGVLDYDGY